MAEARPAVNPPLVRALPQREVVNRGRKNDRSRSTNAATQLRAG